LGSLFSPGSPPICGKRPGSPDGKPGDEKIQDPVKM